MSRKPRFLVRHLPVQLTAPCSPAAAAFAELVRAVLTLED